MDENSCRPPKIVRKRRVNSVHSVTSTLRSGKGKVTKIREKKRHLVEKLLSELTSKYNTKEVKNSCYVARIEKKTMIHDIKMLCQMLITTEQTLQRNDEVF